MTGTRRSAASASSQVRLERYFTARPFEEERVESLNVKGARRAPWNRPGMAPITFGSAMPAFLPPRTQVSIARFLDHMGFDNLWLADHMAYPDLSPAPDAWSIIAAMASSTRRMKLGTAVSDPHR
ncbi:MAG: LLM class flavin-dependent oxidoreductase, partial [Armatimonadetes bacterium]|nr:LLM class flavin-dependent oxidoreductase [Armatimonadota bacterium]